MQLFTQQRKEFEKATKIVIAIMTVLSLTKGLFTLSERFNMAMNTALSMLGDQAEISTKAIVGVIIALTVGLIMLGYLLPVGFTGYHAINFSSTGMTTDEQAIYGVLGIFALICVLLVFISVAMSKAD